ncbi:MAG: nucleoside 2-deoxyribosyltransferase [Candidatus Sumerlaeaceae bacterium]|nr:nucleoside 2-deoxyribosyltransferase [Candidatus Sumerlaeaceae bacterium]
MDGLKPLAGKLVYLAGAVEHAPDGGRGWRQTISTWLKEELKLDVFDPCVQELALLSPQEKVHLRGWKATDPNRFRTIIRRFVDNDLRQLLKATCFVVCLWDEYAARGAGTAGELTVAYWSKIPVYLVSSLSPTDIPGWILACATEVFTDFEQMKRRLVELYGQQRLVSSSANVFPPPAESPQRDGVVEN